MEKENIENLFTEEDTTQEVNNAFADLPPVAPVNYEEETTEVKEEIVEPVKEISVEEAPVKELSEEVKASINKEVLENPSAKVTLQTAKEEKVSKREIEELKGISLKDNSSLRFVLILGVILLIVIFLIPYVSKYI